MINSASELRELRISQNSADYGRASADQASVETWLEIVKTMPDMREWVAHNKTVPEEVLAVLAMDTDARVRMVVASKRKLPEPLQELLAADKDSGVRQRIACNAKASNKVLRRLAFDEEAFVRESALRRLA